MQRRVPFIFISFLEFAVSLSIIYNSCTANYFTSNVLRHAKNRIPLIFDTPENLYIVEMLGRPSDS